jgi:microsomal dipeptidase-like Zn-dependent dipeptidase
MAELQDELHTTVEVGEVGPPAAWPESEPLPSGAGLDGDPRLDVATGTPDRAPATGPGADPLARARAFLAGNPIADGYSGLPWALRHLPWFDLELGESAVDTDVPRLREGHVGALFWSLHLPEGLAGDRAVGATLEQLDLVKTVVRAHPEGLRMTHGAAEIEDARNCGRVAVVLGPAGARALGDSLGILRALHALGLRVLTLAGASWASEAGLTRFGEEVLREMNRLGVLADLSGTSDATIGRALAASKAPVLFTRSAARALRPHPSNLPDEVLVELGAAKGLCMVPLTAEQTGPSVRDVADHLDHVRGLAGAECVGLSGTYDSGAAHPQDLADASCYPHLIAELITRGWAASDLALLTWGNVQRVLLGADFTARVARQRRAPSAAKIADLDG